MVLRVSWYGCVLRVIIGNVWPEKLPFWPGNVLGGE